MHSLEQVKTQSISFQFNLAINENPDVAAEVKKVTSGRLPSKESPLCIEISLKTSEVRAVLQTVRV